MVKRWIWALTLTVFLFFFSGCQKQIPRPVGRAVTQVDVIYRRPGQTLTRTYTQENKMRAILTYLRLLEPGGYAAIDPETTRGESSTITVTLSDGCQRVYHQQGSEYLRRDHTPWQRIRGLSSHQLYLLIHAIETDKV